MKITFPQAFEARMNLNLGEDWNKFQSAHESDPPVSLRINPQKNQEVIDNPIPWTPLGKYLDQRPVFTLDPLFHAGAYYVQEASSMFLEQVFSQSADLSKPLRILDACAAPGGKSTHLLSLIGRDSLLVSNEVIQSRATTLSTNIQKWGYPNVLVTANDPEDFQRIPGFFDLIVVDAPCSGEGLFRKDPASIGEWSEENATLCVQRQRRILSGLWPALSVNGVLIYCTCTYNEAENEDNLNWFAKLHGAESVVLTQNDFPGIMEIRKNNVTAYRFYPHRVKGEGFFIAAIRKTVKDGSARKKSRAVFPAPNRKTRDQLVSWLRYPQAIRFIQQNDLIVGIPESSDIEYLSEHLRVITKGTAMATLKHDKLVPEHAAALSIDLQTENFTRVHVNKLQAIAYLRKDLPNLEEKKQGFALVMYEGLALGWVNLLGNRMNNLYPSSWRIRMGS